MMVSGICGNLLMDFLGSLRMDCLVESLGCLMIGSMTIDNIQDFQSALVGLLSNSICLL